MPELNPWSRERNTSMKVFSKLYVGLKSQSKGVELGFATPYEENAAGRKRQETVDSWVENGYYDYAKREHVIQTPKTMVIENTAAPGFKITDDVKRVYWGGGNVVWRVEDPRGFELEIQSNNLMALIQSCGIEKDGLIPGNCVWGRSGKDNILLHETSDEYKDAVKAAETLKAPKQVGKASRQIGNVYRRVDGSLGIYLGKVHVITMGYEDNRDFIGRVNLPSGVSLQVNQSTYVIKPSVEYEAVQSVEQGKNDEVRPTTHVKLYKKAPLVDDIGVHIDVTIDNSYLLQTNWEFASSATTAKRIVSVTVNPILNPEFCLVSLPKHLYDKKMSNLELYGQHSEQKFPPVGYLLPWQEDEAIVFGDSLCCHIAMIGEAYENRAKEQTEPTYYIGLPLVLAGNTITYTVMPHQYSNPLVPRSQTWSAYQDRHRDSLLAKCDVVPFVKLPPAESRTELVKYAQHLFENRAMFYITAREAK